MAIYRHAYVVLGPVQPHLAPTRGTVPQQCLNGRWHVWRWRSASGNPEDEPVGHMPCDCQRFTYRQFRRQAAA